MKVLTEEAEPKDPTLVLTVASVVAKAPAVEVTSPVKAGKLVAGRAPVN